MYSTATQAAANAAIYHYALGNGPAPWATPVTVVKPAHSVAYAANQTYTNGDALGDDIMRLDVVECDGRRRTALAYWDGADYTTRCACGVYLDASMIKD